MKPVFTLIFSLLFTLGYSQADSNSYSLVITAPVLLGGNAALYSAASTENNTVYLLDGRLTLYMMVPGNAFQAEHLFRVGKILPQTAWEYLEYRVSVNYQQESWHPLPAIGLHAPAHYQVADVVLNRGDQLMLEIRRKPADTLVQTTVFKRMNWQPAIDSWRQHRNGGQEEEKYSGYLLQSAVDSGQRLPANIHYLSLAPGRPTDLLWHDVQLNRDSGWEYRLVHTNDPSNGPWLPSGRLLRIPSLPGNSHFILAARYAGQQNIAEYYISTTAYWYQSTYLVIFIIILSGALIGGLLLYRQRRRDRVAKYQKNILENQLLLVHNQLNPHFIRNSFNSINSLISSGDNDRASQYLTVFSDMMHHTMSVSNKPVISLASDLDQMEEYLRIEQLRFGFSFQFNIAPDINLNAIELPPQLLQPSFENAVRHGAASLYEEGMVRLDVSAAGHDLLIKISNNRSAAGTAKKEGGGYGLKLTNEQILNLRQLYKERRISFKLERLPDGAIAHFFFENWLIPE